MPATDEHLGTHAIGRLRRVSAYHPIANDDDFAGAFAQNRPQEDTFASVECRLIISD
ncbi:MAG: hypothetical protein OEU26_10880 [Candidatus Tectomicrobia bacterium]|nr:hypothetical protein [Candidatus Tectomicrobia bacterium]